jgi:colanic acid biosynthesis glycosyl transferase WcaI
MAIFPAAPAGGRNTLPTRLIEMRIQLWSYNYDPESSGIGPLSTVVARALAERGHTLEVVAAHPHYPEPRWGRRLRPYREQRDGIGVVRLPIWPGRGSAARRIRQEASFTLPLAAAIPFLGRPDVLIAVSPSFPGLGPAMLFSRARRIPWVLWLQDILPDGAMATGVLREGRLIDAARRFELAAYRSARRILVISDSFRDNLIAKGVPEQKLVRVYNPATRPVRAQPRPEAEIDHRAVLNMGNIGHTQNLTAITRAFEESRELEEMGATLTMAGDGVAGDEVRRAIRTDRVTVTGMVGAETLEPLLLRAAVGLVSQSYEGVDFNVPSKLSNFLGWGLPVVAAVRPESEVAKIVQLSGAGWVTASPTECAATLATALADPAERSRRGASALAFAQGELTPEQAASRIERAIAGLTPSSA